MANFITPVILFTVVYALGIIIGKVCLIPIQPLLMALAVSLIASLILIRQKPVTLFILMIFIAGMLAYQFSSSIPHNDISRFANEKYVRVTGSVVDEPAVSGDTVKFTIRAFELIVRRVRYNVSGQFSVFIRDPKQDIRYGYQLKLSGKLSGITSTLNPGIASFGDMMAQKGIRCQMFTSASGVEILKKGIGNPLKFIAFAARGRFMRVIQDTMEEPYSSLLGAVLFGSQASPVPTDIKDDFRETGVIHLLVASGIKVSILLSMLVTLCQITSVQKNLRFILLTFANVIFALIAGAGPSIMRAAIMGEAVLISKMLERTNGFYNSLCLSAFIMLVFDPLSVFDIGFQLSFVGTWALFYAAPVLEERLKECLPQWFAGMTAVSIAPTISTMPLILYNLNQVSFIAVLSNFLLFPWFEITVITGFASTAIGLIFLPLAWAVNNALMLALALMKGLVSFFAGLPFACMYFQQPNLLFVIGYYIILISVIEMLKKRMKIGKLILASVLMAVIVFSWGGSNAAGRLTVTVIDVGQGDSILIEAPSGQKVLIDGGGKESAPGKAQSVQTGDDAIGRSIVVPFLRKKGINELNLVVLTHPHDDHVGGLVYVLDKIKVDEVMDGGQEYSSRDYKSFLKEINDKKIPYVLGRAWPGH